MDRRRRSARVTISIGLPDGGEAGARGFEHFACRYAIDVEDALGSVYEHGEATFALPGPARPDDPAGGGALLAWGETSQGALGLFTLRRVGAGGTLRIGMREPGALSLGRGAGDGMAANIRGCWRNPGPEVFSATLSLKGETALILGSPRDRAGLRDVRASDAFHLRMRIGRAGSDEPGLSFGSDLTHLPHGARIDILAACLAMAFHHPARAALAPSA